MIEKGQNKLFVQYLTRMILSCYKAKVQFTLEVEIKKKDADCIPLVFVIFWHFLKEMNDKWNGNNRSNDFRNGLCCF